MLKGKKILLGVCGGIAAYKICSLVRELKKLNNEVRVVMTPTSTQFVTPLTFSTLSENEVLVDFFPPNTNTNTNYSVNHIKLSLWADLILIAPATANTIAKITYGFADNLLTSLVLAKRCPVALCPSMDVDMYENPITQKNLSLLRERGFFIIEPETGFLASGLSGKGRLPEISSIIQKIDNILNPKKDLLGKKVLITAGPTREFIDPVRFISNRSSGKMGYELAKATKERGAEVTLISGPVNLNPIPEVNIINVITAEQMFEEVKKHYSEKDIIIMSAAVSDYTIRNYSTHKLKKEANELNLTLNPTQDILLWLGENKNDKTILIGFALETNNDIDNAIKKLETKKADIIILNNPLIEGAGFETDTNIIKIIDKNKNITEFPKLTKYDLAHKIIDYILNLKS
ncbi:MAG TPA: bifunctional phosphopantothenoylcysteine decarboxylase/phosphopantothenate--cysteine ligase CoaBC [Ignavibacteria bacterium]